MPTARAQQPGRPRRSGLQQRKHQLTIDALVRAAQQGMYEHGLDVTVDVIAATAEVNRRTVFRHFPTREDLMSAGVVADYDDHLRSVPPYTGEDWQGWLAEVARWRHHNMARVRRLAWDFLARPLSPRMAAVYAEQNQKRQDTLAMITSTLWQAAGGDGATPELLRQTVRVHLSGLFTQAVLRDAEGTADLAAELAATAITSTVRQLLGAAATKSSSPADMK
jgi:AcrR family transcriptional regulator